MFRSHRDEREKELRRLSKEYQESWQRCRDEGEWVDVEPYQRGWIRSFELRDDAKNRDDVRSLRRVLDLTNETRFCRNTEFLERDWKTGKMVPMKQELKSLTEDQFLKLDEQMQSYFTRQEWYDINRYTNTRNWIVRYFVRPNYKYYFVFKIEPNMVTQEWIPSNEAETRRAEVSHYIERNGLWDKINHIHGNSSHYHDWRPSLYRKNKLGMMFNDDVMENDVA